MINQTESEEREYLEEIKEKLHLGLRRADSSVREFSEELRKNKEYIYENQSGMDEADMVAAGQSIDRMAFTGESAALKKKKLLKLLDSPYFGRVDFETERDKDRSTVYIGIYSYMEGNASLIHDWRAPVSSMFYDFELGAGWYKTPSGIIATNILLKRQYKIRDGAMEFMIESEMNIHDDILQKELSKTSHEKMKTIVATIQRDQNAIIRNESSSVMIIQGVAGSGKTSLGLHRIAFLLYRFRDTVASKNILIISPNKVFADYISNVLPELGEEQIPEMTMDELAADLLENKFRFQSFFQQVYALLEKHDDAFVERIRFKASFEFVSKLNQYIIHIENNYFDAKEIRVAGTVVPYPFIQERFKAYHRIPMLKRFAEVSKEVQQYVRNNVGRKLSGGEKAQIWEAIPRMFKTANLLELYRNFYKWIGNEAMFRMTDNGALEYADVFPLIYCKLRLEGVRTYEDVKHLVVDEMQDYSPVQYAVLSRLFRCKKTIVGDVNQVVNPYSASSAEAILKVFPQADLMKLTRSYRSTWEITQFSLRISPNPELIPIERHGNEPVVKGFSTNEEEVAEVREIIQRFRDSPHHSLAILAKTQEQSEFLYHALRSEGAHLINADSTSFRHGVIITTVHLAKGLEFDEVIVPFASARNYQTEVDRKILYVACTRAMHELTVTFTNERTKFISSDQSSI